ncbi:putative esterase, FIGfam005057 [Hydrogenimonas sp.]|nr:putative esterase, FIGfam005057 [Hydrogenimonas sp.]
MIIYIHGFASSGRGDKALTIRRYFKKEAVAPSISYIPDLAMDTLKQLVESFSQREQVSLIGSSLGGFYAACLSEMYDLPAVLINPSTEPHITLASHTGPVTNFYDLSSFEWSERHVKELERLRPESISKPENFMLLLQKGDETLDYRVARERFQGAKIVIEEGGSHSFEGFERYLGEIESFLKRRDVAKQPDRAD